MDDLDQALADISTIRRQVARTTEFRGLGPVTLAFTALLGVVAALVQAALFPVPATHVGSYLLLWIGTAALALGISALQMYTRARRMHSGMSDEMMHMAVEQFLPTIGAGLLLSFVLVRAAPGAAWLLPGLWQILYSLGVFASCRFLPRAMPAAGVWYLVTGLAAIAAGQVHAFSPWIMGAAFGSGQLLIAAVLWFANHEERHGR